MSFSYGVMIPNSGTPMIPVGAIVSLGTSITLSNNTIADSASIGTTVGTLAVSNGSGSYTFTLEYNPNSLFSISGSSLQVAAALGAFDGITAIGVHADNGAGSVLDQAFLITITAASSQSEPIPIIF